MLTFLKKKKQLSFLKPTNQPTNQQAMLTRHFDACNCLLREWKEVRYPISSFLANPTTSAKAENSATWVEITPGNVILCTSMKRQLLLWSDTGFEEWWWELKRWPYRKVSLRESTFWNFFLWTIQTPFFLMESSSEPVLPLLKHKVTPPSPCCPQPTTPPGSSSLEHRVQWTVKGRAQHSHCWSENSGSAMYSLDNLQGDSLTLLSLPSLVN